MIALKLIGEALSIEIQSFSSGFIAENCFIVFLALLIDTVRKMDFGYCLCLSSRRSTITARNEGNGN